MTGAWWDCNRCGHPSRDHRRTINRTTGQVAYPCRWPLTTAGHRPQPDRCGCTTYIHPPGPADYGIEEAA